jgi:hypothetical protein
LVDRSDVGPVLGIKFLERRTKVYARSKWDGVWIMSSSRDVIRPRFEISLVGMIRTLTWSLIWIASTRNKIELEPVVVAWSGRRERIAQMMAMTVIRYRTRLVLKWSSLRRKIDKIRRIVAKYLSDGGTDLCYMDKTSDRSDSWRRRLIRVAVFGRVSWIVDGKLRNMAVWINLHEACISWSLSAFTKIVVGVWLRAGLVLLLVMDIGPVSLCNKRMRSLLEL